MHNCVLCAESTGLNSVSHVIPMSFCKDEVQSNHKHTCLIFHKKHKCLLFCSIQNISSRKYTKNSKNAYTEYERKEMCTAEMREKKCVQQKCVQQIREKKKERVKINQPEMTTLLLRTWP